MQSHGHVLIYTGNAELFRLLEYILDAEGFSVRLCDDPGGLLSAIRAERPLAVLADCSGPRAEALSLCRRINDAGGGQVRVAAFAQAYWADIGRDLDDLGVDMVICRPIEPRRLLRFLWDIRANLAAGSRPCVAPEQTFRHADVEMSLARVQVTRSGQTVSLSALQFRLLLQLMKMPEVVHSRDELIAAGWPPETEVEPRTVDIHIGHIRRALNRYGPDIIRTVRSVGYSLNMSPQSSRS